MGIAVYANGMSIACKAASGKSAAAFPDVCLSPPSPPAGPIPLPYPNTAMASDTDKGSKTVQIGGQEVMLKDKSVFKKSTGNEAATKNFGMGVVTHQIQGEASFIAWSMDVKFEGENVPRHLDLMGHNEACQPTDTPPWPYLDKAAVDLADDHPCKEDADKENVACKGLIVRNNRGKVVKKRTKDAICADNDDARACRAARKCRLAPYDEGMCCPGEQPHHLVEDHWVKNNDAFPWYRSLRDMVPRPTRAVVDAWHDQGLRTDEDAPCVCAVGNKWREEHGESHVINAGYEQSFMQGGSRANVAWDYGAARIGGSMAHNMVFPRYCDSKCIEKQLDAFYGEDKDRPLNPPRRIPPNTNPSRGWTEQEAQPYLNPDNSLGTLKDIWPK